jgi:hypothetical protein
VLTNRKNRLKRLKLQLKLKKQQKLAGMRLEPIPKARLAFV